MVEASLDVRSIRRRVGGHIQAAAANEFALLQSETRASSLNALSRMGCQGNPYQKITISIFLIDANSQQRATNAHQS
ncbi:MULTISPECIES: hypothetical protein [Burkholderia]|uniref:hypothetical protein n=1 Tax=Burkholderia TaxID=32008 RepID=UPI0011801CFF|nr:MULTISPECIES: hypothetical protein [Burkholderia]